MTSETALTVARLSAENGATLKSPSHSATRGRVACCEPRGYACIDAPELQRGRFESRPNVHERSARLPMKAAA